ncbi:trichoplein keratin filament-binding protein-like [Atheta coriaria]|uniref:trichoplein keratin filament-binding protein-like n=1 Tax=Dalotia coriaria TaxID=877792 RepID=UPI0031F44510
MIDEVMLDKVALNKRCEELLAESLTRDIKYKNNLKAMEERHAEELRRAKELLKAAKAEWATSKEKVKKVPSVKCIENELLALNDRFAQKEFELQRNHEQEIRLVRQELEKAKATELQILKEKLTAEKETALEAERQRLHEQHQEEITKMTKLHESQKQSWSKYFADRVKDCEVREAHARSVLDQEIERIKQDTARQIEAVNEQHQFELVIEKDKMKLQMQKFTVDVEKKLEVVMQKKEIEIRKQVISERDVQIEKITEEFQRVLSREKSNYLTNIAELVEKNKITVNNYEKQLTESNDLKISTHKVLQSLQIELNDITQQLQTKNMVILNIFYSNKVLMQYF